MRELHKIYRVAANVYSTERCIQKPVKAELGDASHTHLMASVVQRGLLCQKERGINKKDM